jgi:hypothetical protein
MPDDGGIKEQIAKAERIAFENSAPLSLQQLKDLFSYLNEKPQCDNTFKDTLSFVESHQLKSDRVIPWLREHGASCDCEVIYNVYDHFGELVGRHLDA